MWHAGLLAIWPLYGAALGGAGVALFVAASQFLPAPVAAATGTVFWAGWSSLVREDLRIGAPHGPLTVKRIIPRALAAAIWIGAFVHQGSSHSGVFGMAVAAAAAQCISRAGALALAWTSPPAAGGLELCARLRTFAVVPAVLTGVLAASMYGLRMGIALVVGAYLILRGAWDWFDRQHSGIDGDDVTNARMAVECFAVLMASFVA